MHQRSACMSRIFHNDSADFLSEALVINASSLVKFIANEISYHRLKPSNLFYFQCRQRWQIWKETQCSLHPLLGRGVQGQDAANWDGTCKTGRRINKQTEREELRSYTSIGAFFSLTLFIWDFTRCLSVIVEKYGFRGRKPCPPVIIWSQNKNRHMGGSLQRKLNIWVC